MLKQHNLVVHKLDKFVCSDLVDKNLANLTLSFGSKTSIHGLLSNKQVRWSTLSD